MAPKLIRIPPIVPVAGDIYKGDNLDRRPDCEHLRDAILAAQTPCTLAINASWGAGKTVFLQMLREECKAAGMSCVYFDAWKNDFHSDALPPMIGQIEMQMQGKRELPAELIDAGRELCRKAPLAALAAALGVAGDAATGGAATAIKGAGSILKTMGKESDAVEEYVARQKAMENFRNALGEFAAPKNGESKPLVFFVDELDRCRPIFAVEVLEKIKHVFDVPGVFFVLAVNKEELKKTLLSVYGEINPTLYLRKFFDFEFNLENRRNVVMAALKRGGVSAEHVRDSEHLYDYLPKMCQDFSLSPRDQEQIAALMARALTLTPSGKYFYSVYFAFFVALKFANPDLYQRCLRSARFDLSAFPYSEMFDYYKSATGVFQDMGDAGRGHPHIVPMLHLCAMRYHNDSTYREDIDKKSWEQEALGWSAYKDIRVLGGRVHSYSRTSSEYVLTYDPRPILEAIEIGAKERR